MSVDIAALKAAQARGLTVGVVPKDGKPALRLEIDDFIQDTELANLYFLALEALMSSKEHEKPFSYHEISGIHGQPYRPWDGVSSANFERTGRTNPTSGYCSHGSAIFPTWHRAYLAMYEQAVFLKAVEIAPSLGAEAVLDRFRIPYFDPLLPRQRAVNGSRYTYGLPVIMMLPEILLRRPESPNTWTLGPNPLYRFNFPDDRRGGFDWSRYRNWGIQAGIEHTIRGLYTTAGLPDHGRVMQEFDNVYNPFNGLSSQSPINLWRVMFDPSQDWVQMSNHFDRRDRRTYNANSLEGFHDNIHGELAGFGGHMGFPEFAGYDPSFWLHHCNVDRLLAIWQGIHSEDPDTIAWWTTLDVPMGNFVEPANQHETPQTPLVPFRKSGSGSQVRWWNSNDVRDHRKLGYDYPQTAAALVDRNSSYVKSLVAWANDALGWLSPRTATRTGPDEEAIADFTESVSVHIPFFPKNPLVDGRQNLLGDKRYIGSRGTAPVPTPAPGGAASARSTEPARDTPTQPSKASTSSAVRSFAFVKSTKPGEEKAEEQPQVVLQKRAIAKAIPVARPTAKERFQECCDIIDHDKMTQWSASFSVEKFALDGTFRIYFFLGDFTHNHHDWALDPHLAGSSTIFASTRERLDTPGGCDNCKKQEEAGIKYADTISLTQALLVYFHNQEEVYGHRITDMRPETVIPFLRRNLHWRIVNWKDDEAPRDTIPSLRVMVYSETVDLPHQLSDKPAFHDQTAQYEVTDGRPCGVSTGGEI